MNFNILRVAIPFLLMMVCIYFALIETSIKGVQPFNGLSLGMAFTTMIFCGDIKQ
jgi:hypothetical protein